MGTPLEPSRKARSEIKSAAEFLGSEMTHEKVRELTGYDLSLIRHVLKGHKRPKPMGRPPVVNTRKNKPKFIEEIENNLQLECILMVDRAASQEWLLLSPTGVPVLKLIGFDDLLQFTRVIKEPCKVFQHLTAAEILKRRTARRKK